MFPAPFEYHDPTTLDDTLTLLGERAPEARLLAGGQSLVAAMNLGIARPGVVIDLQRVGELAGIAEDQGCAGHRGDDAAGGGGTFGARAAGLPVAGRSDRAGG